MDAAAREKRVRLAFYGVFVGSRGSREREEIGSPLIVRISSVPNIDGIEAAMKRSSKARTNRELQLIAGVIQRVGSAVQKLSDENELEYNHYLFS